MAEVERKQFLARFEDFELDTRTGELRQNGAPVTRLSQQPLRLLLALIDRPGELVLREDLRQKLWPGGTVVEFEHSINAAMKRLRQVLGDSPLEPHFIETLTRRGYRWRTSVEWRNGAPSSIPLPASAVEPAPKNSKGYRVFATVMALAISMLAAGRILLSRQSSHDEPKLTQLTWNSTEIPVRTTAISPNAKLLAYTDLNGIHIKVLSTNEVRTVPQPESVQGSRVDWAVIDWFPDGMEFVAQILPFDEGCAGCDPFSTWIVSVLGGPPRKIRDGSAAESISPDGSKIAYTAMLGKPGGKEIWIMDRDGNNSKIVARTDGGGWLRYAKWSPDGKRLAYVNLPEFDSRKMTLESKSSAGGEPTTILADANAVLNFTWLPDGSILYVAQEPKDAGCNYWKVPVDSITGHPTAPPKKVTNWSGFCLDTPSSTADGKHLVFIEKENRGSIYVAQIKGTSGQITTPKLLSLTEASNQLTGWTLDSRSVVFTSDHDRVTGLYRQTIDSDNADLILAEIHDFGSGHAVSPDGKWILYTAVNDNHDPKAPQKIIRVPLNVGPVETVLSGDIYGVRCARLPFELCVLKEWSPDHKGLVFSYLDPYKGRVRELFRMSADDDTNWQLSPDGTKIALFGVQGPLRIRSLRDQSVKEVIPKKRGAVDYIAWTGDSRSLYGSTPTQQGDALVHLDLNGHTKKIWESRGSFDTSAMSSPDGKSLAIQSWSIRSNVWMLENF